MPIVEILTKCGTVRPDTDAVTRIDITTDDGHVYYIYPSHGSITVTLSDEEGRALATRQTIDGDVVLYNVRTR